MTTTRAALSDGDIRQLLKGAEPEERALAAHRLCRHIDRPDLTQAEPDEAHEILRLMSLVSGELRDELIARQSVSAPTAIAIAMGAHERASLDLVEQAARAADLPAFVAHLHRGQRLTASLMLRALAHGQVGFFEWG